jgi:pimeloyl-ACP methyl ester carboxylesterase
MRLVTRLTASGVVLAAPLLVVACAQERSLTAPTSPDADVESGVEAAAVPAATWASVVDGEDGGGVYRLMVPAPWNGDLVVLAHGYVDPDSAVRLPAADFAAFADSVGRRGFAVAFSSYSENGSAIKDGAERTHALTDVFTGQFGAPGRVLLGGQSMGGLVALDLAERFPTQYSGVYSFCGETGGAALHIRYLTDVRALFDVFYRKPDPDDPTRTVALLPGDALHVDRAGLDLEAGVRQVARNAMLANDAGARAIVQISRTPIPFAPGNRNQMINAVADVLFRHARAIDDVMARGHDGSPVDNTDVVYTGAGIPQATLDLVNANVQRFASTKFAEHEAEKYYEPDGSLRIPFVSLRSARDPALPAPLNDDVYLAKLSKKQRDELVEVRVVNTFGHCTATIQDVVNGFDALVRRVDAMGAE